MQSFKNIVKSINHTKNDIKTEVIVADLLEKNVDLDALELIFDGVFERNYNRDLTKAYVNMISKVIALHISRNSLYDNLPEGLFHPVTRYLNLDADDRKKEFARQKQEEEKARRFFRPIDKEFFVQKTKLETEVRKLINNPFNELEELFTENRKALRNHFKRLVKFLPFTNYIKGDPLLTSQCLSELLGDKVDIDSYYTPSVYEHYSNNKTAKLSHARLGENFICGTRLIDNVLLWDFRIEVNDEKKLEQYIDKDNGFMMSLIQQFYNFFVPIEIKVKTKVISSSQSMLFLHSEGDKLEPEFEHANQKLYLGYNIKI